MSSCPRLPRSWSVISTGARARPRSSTLPARALVLPANEYREHPSSEIYLPPLCVASSRMLAPLVPCHILARALVHTPSASLHLFREREPQALVVLKINYADRASPARALTHPARARSCRSCPVLSASASARPRSWVSLPRALAVFANDFHEHSSPHNAPTSLVRTPSTYARPRSPFSSSQHERSPAPLPPSLHERSWSQ